VTGVVIHRFDGAALHAALDARRVELGLSWRQVADGLWLLSSELNPRRRDHPISPSTLTRTWKQLADLLACTPSQLTGLRTARFATDMDLAMRIVQWIGRPAADFVYPARW
jgi:hypothetical protein